MHCSWCDQPRREDACLQNIDLDELSNPWKAAISSGIAFIVGAGAHAACPFNLHDHTHSQERSSRNVKGQLEPAFSSIENRGCYFHTPSPA